MKRILALLMATLMICAVFAGCGDKKADEVTLSKNIGEITKEVYTGGLRYAEAMLQQTYGLQFSDYLDMDMGDGTTGADFIRENTNGMFREFESVKVIAAEKGIEFTAEDKAELLEYKKQTVDEMGGKKAFKEQLEASGVNESLFDYISHAQFMYQKVYETLFTGEGEYALDADGILKSATDGGYIRVKHVLVQTTEDAEDFEEKKALANEIAAKATAGEDFDALIQQYGEDPGMTSVPYGYIIDQNGYTTTGSGMVSEFTAGSIALEVGGVSAPIKTDYGFHIIKRYPIDVESINANFNEFQSEFTQLAVTEVLNEYLQKTTPVYPEGYEEIDLHDVFPAAESVEVPEADSGIEVGTAEPATPEVTVEPVATEATDAPAAQ